MEERHDAIVNCAPFAAKNKDWSPYVMLTLVEGYKRYRYCRVITRMTSWRQLPLHEPARLNAAVAPLIALGRHMSS